MDYIDLQHCVFAGWFAQEPETVACPYGRAVCGFEICCLTCKNLSICPHEARVGLCDTIEAIPKVDMFLFLSGKKAVKFAKGGAILREEGRCRKLEL